MFLEDILLSIFPITNKGAYSSVLKTTLFNNIVLYLCNGNTLQTVMDCVVNPPHPGEPSYEKFKAEKDAVLKSLAVRAKMVADTFNSIPGMSCNQVQGAMYAFPQVQIPQALTSGPLDVS